MISNDRLRDAPSRFRQLALALATLGCVGFSLVLTCQTLSLTSPLRTVFAERNTLGEHGRALLLLSLALGLTFPAVVGLLMLWRRRELQFLERAATLTAPLALLFIVPGLFESQIAQDKPLYYLVVLAAFGVIFRTLLARALAERRSGPPSVLWSRIERLRLPPFASSVLLLAGTVGFVSLLGHYAVVHHRLIQELPADIGIRDNVMANLLHGHYFAAPAYFGKAGGNWLTVHAEYGAIGFIPLYALRPGAETLLWLQAVLAGSAVFPLYLAASRKLGRATALWIGLGYLLSAPQHGALFAGFGWLPAVTLFSFTLYYAIESERRVLLVVSLIALLSISEAGPLNALGLGSMLIVSRSRRGVGVRLVALALPVIALNVVLAQRGGAAFENSSLVLALSACWRNPVFFAWDLVRAVKIAAVLHALAPLAVLPVLEPSCWPLLIPGILFTSAGTQFWPNGSPNYMDSVVWLPGCFIALVYILEKHRRQGPGRTRYVALLVTLTITQLSHSYDYGTFLRPEGFGGATASVVQMTPWGQSRYDSLRSVLKRLPANASIGVTAYLLSHVSNRVAAYDLSRPYGEPDYILLSTREVSSLRTPLTNTFADHQYRLVTSAFDEFYLFARGAENPETRLALTRLGFAAP